jgi:UDP:flavonoid glycosyltransferase YjiC (YdhE family)
MANILYGVNGEGAGHSTRAKEVLTHLRAQGHTLHVASFDRGLRNLSDQFEVTEIFGFRFAYVTTACVEAKERVSALGTMLSVNAYILSSDQPTAR